MRLQQQLLVLHFNTNTNAFEVNIGSVSLPLWASIADNAITTDKILDGTITTVDIANGAISNKASGISKSKVGYLRQYS
jgi:hypothetical protein